MLGLIWLMLVFEIWVQMVIGDNLVICRINGVCCWVLRVWFLCVLIVIIVLDIGVQMWVQLSLVLLLCNEVWVWWICVWYILICVWVVSICVWVFCMFLVCVVLLVVSCCWCWYCWWVRVYWVCCLVSWVLSILIEQWLVLILVCWVEGLILISNWFFVILFLVLMCNLWICLEVWVLMLMQCCGCRVLSVEMLFLMLLWLMFMVLKLLLWNGQVCQVVRVIRGLRQIVMSSV